jgi:hypothetical protein
MAAELRECWLVSTRIRSRLLRPELGVEVSRIQPDVQVVVVVQQPHRRGHHPAWQALWEAGKSSHGRRRSVKGWRRAGWAGYPWPWSYKRQPTWVLTRQRLQGCQPVGMVPSELPCVYISNWTHSSFRPALDAGT